MANDGEWQTVQYFVEGVKVIKMSSPYDVNFSDGKSKH